MGSAWSDDDDRLPDSTYLRLVDLQKVVPNIEVDCRYQTNNNFIGRPVQGYANNKAYATPETAVALKLVQGDLQKEGLGLKVFDAYRPQAAVDYFAAWAKVESDTMQKALHYPGLRKSDLFTLGYIAEESSHTLGISVDITLIDLNTGEEIDMGTSFDYFSPKSWTSSNEVTLEQKANRLLLQQAMTRHGFTPLETEWWHFSLKV
jgi:D-alanyl-D-alanine dipeptidase